MAHGTHLVAQEGCDDAGPGTEELPFCTFVAAYAEVQPGDVLYIGAGEWDEPLALPSGGLAYVPVVVQGYGDGETKLVGGVDLDGLSFVAMVNLTLGDVSMDQASSLSFSEVVFSGDFVADQAQDVWVWESEIGAGAATDVVDLVVQDCTIEGPFDSAGESMLFRRNLVVGELGLSGNGALVHNVFNQSVLHADAGITVFNNVFVSSVLKMDGLVQGNLFYDEGREPLVWVGDTETGASQLVGNLVADPLIANLSSGDATPDASSPVVDGGVWLSEASQPVEGTDVTLVDASFFRGPQEGQAFFLPDRLGFAQGSQARVVAVKGVDVALDAVVSVGAQEGVSYGFSGVGPDIGLVEMTATIDEQPTSDESDEPDPIDSRCGCASSFGGPWWMTVVGLMVVRRRQFCKECVTKRSQES